MARCFLTIQIFCCWWNYDADAAKGWYPNFKKEVLTQFQPGFLVQVISGGGRALYPLHNFWTLCSFAMKLGMKTLYHQINKMVKKKICWCQQFFCDVIKNVKKSEKRWVYENFISDWTSRNFLILFSPFGS